MGSLIALAERPDIFKLAFCGAAPTDWCLYDTAYTERYLDTPQNNPMGYLASSILTRVEKFPDESNRLFIFHGLRQRILRKHIQTDKRTPSSSETLRTSNVPGR